MSALKVLTQLITRMITTLTTTEEAEALLLTLLPFTHRTFLLFLCEQSEHLEAFSSEQVNSVLQQSVSGLAWQ